MRKEELIQRFVQLKSHVAMQHSVRCTTQQLFYNHLASVYTSPSFLAELSVSSPQKISIFIIKKNIFWIKVSKKYFI